MTHPTVTASAAPLERDQIAQLGLWMFLATVTMLFAAFTSAYIVRRAGSDWRPIALPAVLWGSSLILVASSLAAEVGRRAAVNARWPAARLGFLAAILLGLGFLGGQTLAWQSLVDAGIYVRTLPHASFFYVLTGLHAVHLAAGLVILAAVVPSFGEERHAVAADRISPAGRAGLAATFWHFFGGLWLYVFLLLGLG